MYREAILRELWAELDNLMYQLMTDGAPTESEPSGSWQEWGEIRGRAQGVAFAIASISNLSEPNVEWVRAEAVRRWERGLEGEENPAFPSRHDVPDYRADRRAHGCLAMAFGVVDSACRVRFDGRQHILF